MSTRLSDGFAGALAPYFLLEDLEESRAIIFGLWPDLTLAYVNPAWEAFAEANSGQPFIAKHWGIGASYLDAIPPVLRPFYENFLADTPKPGATLRPTSHVYECSSPTVFRKFRMQVYALRNHAGYIVVNSLVFESPHDLITHAPHGADVNRYVDERGIIVQCSHCRLIRTVDDPDVWEWVPDWVAKSPSNTSHGLCPMCFSYYYAPEAA